LDATEVIEVTKQKKKMTIDEAYNTPEETPVEFTSKIMKRNYEDNSATFLTKNYEIRRYHDGIDLRELNKKAKKFDNKMKHIVQIYHRHENKTIRVYEADFLHICVPNESDIHAKPSTIAQWQKDSGELAILKKAWKIIRGDDE
jgi:hypothetical protein